MSRRGPTCDGYSACPLGQRREFYLRDTGRLECVECPGSSGTVIHRPVAWHARRRLIRPADLAPVAARPAAPRALGPAVRYPSPAAIAAKHAEWGHHG